MRALRDGGLSPGCHRRQCAVDAKPSEHAEGVVELIAQPPVPAEPPASLPTQRET